MLQVDSRVLRALRKSRGFTQDQLAKLVKVSKRQVAEWERERAPGESQLVNIREGNLKKLCQLLNASEEELAGREPTSAGGQIIGNLNYELIEARYGVPRDELIDAAPLLFLVLAKQSLQWRKEQMERCRTELSQQTAERFLPIELWDDYREHLTQSIEREDSALTNEDIFTPSALDVDLGIGFSNRFSDFLHAVGKAIDAELEPGQPESHFPEFLVIPSLLKEICGGADHPQMPRAAFALASGAVQLSKVPEDLRYNAQSSERAEWLASKVPEPAGEEQYQFEVGSMPMKLLFSSGLPSKSAAASAKETRK